MSHLRRRAVWGVPALFFLAFLVLMALATPADAKVTGPCTGTINGHEIHGRVVVPENGTVAWNFDSTGGPISAWSIELIFLGRSIPIDSGSDEEPDKTSKGGVANVNDYAKYGVGVYQLTGAVVTEGGTCEGSVEIVVEGNPLTTTVGGIAAGAAVVGVGGAALAGAGAAKSALAALAGKP